MIVIRILCSDFNRITIYYMKWHISRGRGEPAIPIEERSLVSNKYNLIPQLSVNLPAVRVSNFLIFYWFPIAAAIGQHMALSSKA